MQDERKLLAAYDDGEHEPEGKDYSDELEEEIDEDEEDEEISVPLSSEDDGRMMTTTARPRVGH